MDRDIDRPLGLDRPGKRAGTSQEAGPRLTTGSTALALAALLIVAGSVYSSLTSRPFSTATAPAPAEIAATPAATPVAGVPADPATDAPVEPVSTGGAKIMKVTPEGEMPAGEPAQTTIIIRDPSAVGQDLRVAHLPDRALIEQSEQGPLPVIAADGRKPYEVYARPWSGARGARVAIVIGGLGLSQTGTQRAVEALPGEVTLAFAPQGNSLGRWMQAARQKGHEILMQVPLEPFDYPNVNPGRNTLTVGASADENRASLRWALSRTTNYAGIMNYMGARFVADTSAMDPFMKELGQRGLLYLDDGSTARSVAQQEAEKNGVPFAAGDLAIDAVRDKAEILRRLDQLEATARAKGYSVGAGSAFDVTVDTVAGWVKEARKRGIEIVPVSAIATLPKRS